MSEFDYKAPPNQVTQQEVIEAMAACVRKAAMLLVVYHPRHVKSSATPLDKLPPAEPLEPKAVSS